MIIDNNTQRFPRGTFANSRVRLDIDGHFCGNYTAELPKRRNGVIELTVYDDMIKLDTEFPEDCEFPSLFWTVYAHCLLKAGLADHFSVVNGDIFVLNALFNVGVISHEYTDYIYANSCRNVVSGMAEWNGGFAYINDDGKLQVDVFSKEVSKTFYSSELMELDYSDETIVFSKVKTSQKNKTYEMGDDSGYTLVINNQYIGYGLDDDDFEVYLDFICDYYKGFSLTPMSFTLAEPDFSLKIGDRISVVDGEENVTVTGNISTITVSGNCSMTVTCGGFGNVSGVVNYNRSSTGQNNQIKAEVAQASSAGAISSYEYLSDPSVKINSLTYTVEKNAAGLITKITDSLGNTLKPKISGDITEIALHNAALWGAVMARGIWSSRVNPNLLDNSDFRINQRGQSSYSSEGYTVDRWKQDSRTKVTAESDGIRVECIRSTAEPWAGVAQIAEAPFVVGDSYTISLYVADILGVWRLRSDNAADGVELKLTAGLNVLTFSVAKLKPSFSNNGININITSETRAGDYFKLQWAKLEVGETATDYTAPDPADELRECQRFYQIHSSGSLSPDELDPPMRATPTVTRLPDGNYAYSADF